MNLVLKVGRNLQTGKTQSLYRKRSNIADWRIKVASERQKEIDHVVNQIHRLKFDFTEVCDYLKYRMGHWCAGAADLKWKMSVYPWVSKRLKEIQAEITQLEARIATT